MAKRKKKQKYKKKKIAKPELLKATLNESVITQEKQQKAVKINKQKAKKIKKEIISKEQATALKASAGKKEKKPLFNIFKKIKEAKKVKHVEQKPEPAPKKTEPEQQQQAAKPAKTPLKERVKIYAKTTFPRQFRKPIIALFTILGFALIFVFASVLITFELTGKTLPGTRVAGTDVSFLNIDEVQNKLMEKGKPFLENKILVTMEGATQEFTPQELGISLDPRSTIQDLEFVQFGKTGLFSVILGLFAPTDIPYYVSVDTAVAAKNIETKFNFAEKKSSNAYLTFEDDKLVVVPQKEGQTIDLRSLYLSIKKNANSLSLSPINVVLVDDKPLVTKEKLEAALDNIKETLKNKITLSYENYNYTVKLIDHIDWVKFDYKDTLKIGDKIAMPIEVQGGENVNLQAPLSVERTLWISIEKDPFIAWVQEEISPEIETEPQDVEISKDENGKIIFNGRGENGRKIINSFLVSALNEAVNNNISDVVIPVQEKLAQVKTSEELQQMGIKTLIATGRSAFAGSPTNRIYNINVGIVKFDGILIAPGETFSFNEHLGPVDASTGYKPELVIKAEGTIPEYGGGLCQVSSTMYRAALLAGLPIVERAPHSYAVSYYAQILGYGMDATIYPGVHDLKFINDTPGYILVQSYTDGVKAFYKFYGTDDGRRVKLEGPYSYGYHSAGTVTVESPTMAPGARKQVEIAHTGFNTTWYRYITKAGETVKETINSTYRAMPAKILVGPSAAPAESAP